MRGFISKLRGILARGGSAEDPAGDRPLENSTEEYPVYSPAVAQCEHDPVASEVLPAEELPAYADLDASSDYRPFLRKTVSAEMKRAGLRRAWACDPAIASFKGFADYDWDANAVGYGWLRPADAVLAAATLLGQAERKPGEDGLVTVEVELEARDDAERQPQDTPPEDTVARSPDDQTSGDASRA
jgi:hypothetical protein